MNDAIILTLAYPETIVMVAEEWYSPYLKYFGIGKQDYVRAGHAAMVLINKQTGELEYHDFGRYITPEPTGRVRGKLTDNELDFPLKATVINDDIENLDEILSFLGTHPKLTHGDGILLASVCKRVDYKKAKLHIKNMQHKSFIYYAAFKKDACNCARFVTEALIAGVTCDGIRKQLKRSKWFTPSTVGNVIIANTENQVFKVDETGEISIFKGSQTSENIRCFLDRLKNHTPNLIGTQLPKPIHGIYENAQWLSGIAAGAWFELIDLDEECQFEFRRISPYGNIDVHATFLVDDKAFDYYAQWEFVHYSNCSYFHIKQKDKVYRFDRLD